MPPIFRRQANYKWTPVALKVLYVSHTAILGGACISLGQLMAGLDRARYQPVAVFSKSGPLIEVLRSKGIPCYILRRRGIARLGLIREALALIKREGIGLVHLNAAMPFCKYVAMAARIARCPVIWHVREDPRGKRVRRLKKWMRLLAHRIFVVSSDLEAALADTGKVVKIFNGVDIARFTPGVSGQEFRQRFGLPRDAFVFGIVGRIEPRKGQMEFLDAAGRLLAGGRDLNFVIVGTGPDEYVGQVTSLLRSQPELAARTILTGVIEDMPKAMAAFDALVMPSLWEGFPRALIEAMACAKPAVAAAVGEVPEIVADGVTGYLVPPGDVRALCRAMEKCIGRADALGRNARQRVVAHYTIEQHVAIVQKNYADLLGRLSTGAPMATCGNREGP